MSRNPRGKRVKTKRHVTLDLRELCRIAGISTKQRAIMIVYINKRLNGGEDKL